MVRVSLSSSLAGLVPGGDGRSSRRTLEVDAACWSELAEQLRHRYPALAERVLNGGAAMSPGFVLVVNDEVLRQPSGSLALAAGDEVVIFAAVAGGS
jgi:molybdopterin converting factor small subunit